MTSVALFLLLLAAALWGVRVLGRRIKADGGHVRRTSLALYRLTRMTRAFTETMNSLTLYARAGTGLLTAASHALAEHEAAQLKEEACRRTI